MTKRQGLQAVWAGLLVMCLSACITPMLIGSALQSKLMWSLLKPLIGFNPNEVNLFEVPLIKDRMTALLGDKYEPTMQMLRTAQEIQQEGPLIFVASRVVPTEFKAIQDKAGMVWNSDTNQLAVVLVKDGVGQIFAEQNPGATQLVPTLPQELQTAYDAASHVQGLSNGALPVAPVDQPAASSGAPATVPDAVAPPVGTPATPSPAN